jgi:predicted DNA-binding protein (MmcQ/YjbR family)
MTTEEFRDYCLSKKGATEDTPFGPDTVVYRICEKLFALTRYDEQDFRVNLKCEPNYAIELREKYDFILPGYHMNKANWNTIQMAKTNNNLAKSMIDHSYDLIVASFSKKQKEEFARLMEE